MSVARCGIRKRTLTAPLLLVALLASIVSETSFARTSEDAAQKLAAKAGESAASGAFDAAIDQWKGACDAYRKASRLPEWIDALVQLGAAYRGLGQQRLADETLEEALDKACASTDRPRTAAALSSLGAMRIFSRTRDEREKPSQKPNGTKKVPRKQTEAEKLSRNPHGTKRPP